MGQSPLSDIYNKTLTDLKNTKVCVCFLKYARECGLRNLSVVFLYHYLCFVQQLLHRRKSEKLFWQKYSLVAGLMQTYIRLGKNPHCWSSSSLFLGREPLAFASVGAGSMLIKKPRTICNLVEQKNPYKIKSDHNLQIKKSKMCPITWYKMLAYSILSTDAPWVSNLCNIL